VIADSRPWLVRKRLIKKGGGCSPAVLEAAAKRVKGALPAEVREFLFLVEPISMFKEGELNDEGPGEFFFYHPKQSEFKWHSLVEWVPQTDWSGARGLAIGQSGYGDAIFWVMGHRAHPDGCIAVHDHEVAMGDLQCAVFARSLSEFIAKIVCLKGLSPDAMDDDYDDLIDDDEEPEEEDLADNLEGMFDFAGQEMFDEEYGELNPTSERGRKR